VLTDEFGLNDYPDEDLLLSQLEHLKSLGLIYECTWCPQQMVQQQAYGAHRMFHPAGAVSWPAILQAVARSSRHPL
jgi:hypothetical protein